MTKRILVVALLAPMLALVKPAPAAAHVGFLFALGLPFVGAVLGIPVPFYGPAVYGPSMYGPSMYAPPVYAPPAYVPARVYVPARPYGPRLGYPPGRAFVPAYRGHPARAYYRPPVDARRFRRW